MSSPEPRFGAYAELAEVYARSRPSYPSALVDAIVRRAGVQSGDPVAEIGAGTGNFSRILAERGFSVSAVEPVAEMRDAARSLGGIHWSEGTFESTALASGSQRWVVAAQAFHRAKLNQALPEIHRVLEPGGCFTALWYVHHIARHPVLAKTYEMLRKWVPAYNYVDRTRRRHRWPSRVISALPDGAQRALGRAGARLFGGWRRLGRGLELCSTGHFGELSYDELEYSEVIPAERYMDVWRSRSVLQSMAGSDAFDRFLEELRGYLSAEGITELRVPYLYGAWTARGR